MDGVIFALASPLVIKEFGLSIPEFRSGIQIALLVGIAGMFAWPWLADRYGRRTLLAINIAMFSLLMPVLAICTTWTAFVIVRCAVNFALNGEWTLGSMLVAETWPARLRGRVIGINRGTWLLRGRAGGRDRDLYHRGLRMAGRVRGTGRGGFNRCLCPGEVPGVALLGPHAGPQEPHRPDTGGGGKVIGGGPGLGGKGEASPAASVVPSGYATKYWRRDVYRMLLNDDLRHGGRLDAVVSVAGTALGDCNVRAVLYLVGIGWVFWPAGLRLDLRPVRPPAGVLCDAGGRGCVHYVVGVRQDRYRTLDLRPAVEHRVPGLLGTEP